MLNKKAFMVGVGTAVLTSDLRIAVAMENEGLPWSPQGDAPRSDAAFYVFDGLSGERLVDRRVSFRPYDFAATGDTFALLQYADRDDEKMRQAREFKTLIGELRTYSGELMSPWKTDVISLDAQGNTRWTAQVDMAVEMPPVWGQKDRVHLFGDGWIMVDGGKVRIMVPRGPQGHTRGTAFADGSLAVSRGMHLLIVRPNGAISATIPVPSGDAITTPPAIGSDGSIWVATMKQLYVAR